MRERTIRVPQTLVNRPWALDRSRVLEVCQRLEMRAEAISRMDLSAIDTAVQAAASAPLGRIVGAVAIIPVTGVITQKSDFYSWWFGGTSVERLTAAFRQYLNDPAISAIVFDTDSGGGEVYGVPEFFEEVFAARGQKKLISVSNPFMASAAYWIGCACEEVYLLPSGQAGSVGVYTTHEDMSQMLEQMGIDVTFVQYGEHKTEGNPYEPLSDDARAELQANVNFYGQLFDRAVAKGRNVSTADVSARFGQGRVLRAPDAKKVGMVDKVGTLDDVLARLAPKRGRGLSAAIPGSLTAATNGIAPAALDGTADEGEAPHTPLVTQEGRPAELPDPEPQDAPDAAAVADADAAAAAIAIAERL